MSAPAGYWPSPWPSEDGGPQRRQTPWGTAGLDLGPDERLGASSRFAIASTMVVLREPGEVYLLGHAVGPEATAWVEQIDPHTLEPVRRSVDLPGGPTWPGGVAAHANGSLYVVFGNHAHRLDAELNVIASATLPRDRPYNSFVVLPDGHLATKDFAGARPTAPAPSDPPTSELLILEPESLAVVARLELDEPSVARISADGNDISVVGTTSLLRLHWDGRTVQQERTARYRTMAGQTYGWDAVIDAGAAWFLDNGEGSERFGGSFVGIGTAAAPLHLVRVDLSTGAVQLTEICGRPGGLIANPPAIDPERHIAVGYDSANGVVAAFRFDDSGVTTPLWTRPLNHAAHPLRFGDTGELVLCDFDTERNVDQVVVLDLETGQERGRVDTGSPLQSVVFVAPGFERDLYVCSFATVTRVFVA